MKYLVMLALFALGAATASAQPVCGPEEDFLPYTQIIVLMRWTDRNLSEYRLITTRDKDMYVIELPDDTQVCVVLHGRDLQFNGDILKQIPAEGMAF